MAAATRLTNPEGTSNGLRLDAAGIPGLVHGKPVPSPGLTVYAGLPSRPNRHLDRRAMLVSSDVVCPVKSDIWRAFAGASAIAATIANSAYSGMASSVSK